MSERGSINGSDHSASEQLPQNPPQQNPPQQHPQQQQQQPLQRQQSTPSIEANAEQKTVKFFGTDNYWIGQRLANKPINAKTPMLRTYWEQNVERERQQQAREQHLQQQMRRKPFGFPRWRSNDAMTASLVASGKVPTLIPKDSQIPEHRRRLIEEAERQAEFEKDQLQAMARRTAPLGHHHKSMESLASLQTDATPPQWYDKQRLRNAVSRESIANLGAARQKFESGDMGGLGSNHFATEFSYPPSNRSTPVQFAAVSHKTRDAPRVVREPQAPYNANFAPATQNYYDQPCTAAPPPAAAISLSPEHLTLLQYIRQNPRVFNDLGIEIPKALTSFLDGINAYEEGMQSSDRHSVVSTAPSGSPALGRPATGHNQPLPGILKSSGRYVKNNNNLQRYRKTYEAAASAGGEKARQETDEGLYNGAGDSIIAAEIRLAQEREEEFRRSRSELRLPTLEDTFEIWRSGYYAQNSQMDSDSGHAVDSPPFDDYRYNEGAFPQQQQQQRQLRRFPTRLSDQQQAAAANGPPPSFAS